MSHQQARPPVDPKAIKPGRFWYWIAGIVIAVGIGVGVTVFALGVSYLAANMPDMAETFAADATGEVELSADKDWAIYVDYSGDFGPEAECTVAGPDGEVAVTPSDGNFSSGNGDHTWHQIYDIAVRESGTYTVRCDSDDVVGDFAVGEAVDVGGFVGGVFGTLGALVGIPCFSLVVGGVIILVVALRRSSHKKKLRDQPRAPDAPGAW